MLRNPSPRIKPYARVSEISVNHDAHSFLTEARMMRGVLERLIAFNQIHAIIPPAALASVNEGTLYMPGKIRTW